MLSKFNEKAQKIISVAESISFDLGHVSVGSEHLLLIFPIVGTLFSVIGFVLLINKKVQNYLLKLPVSESI